MRASTLFALTAAALVGLGVAITAKYGGFFSRPVPVAVVRQPDVMVLVAAKNLFAGDAIDGPGVRIRALRPDELANYTAHKDKYMPPVPAAAVLRIATKNIEADQVITRDMLKDLGKPEPLYARLLPEMRAVNVSISKERSNGGLVQVGEWAELVLTSTMDGPNGPTTRSVKLVPKVRVIAKRDTLWPTFASLPKDKPVDYTLEVNSYRASLIEYSRTRGSFSLLALPNVDQKQLEEKRHQMIAQLAKNEAVKGQDLAFAGDSEEQSRIDEVEAGDLVVSEADMIKVFDLQPPPTPAPPVNTIHVEQVIGTRRAGGATFAESGSTYVPARPGATNSNVSAAKGAYPYLTGTKFNFRPPEAECKTCKDKRNKQ